jgi:hypothetical protein
VAQRLFIYCERGGDPGFWAEPLNALTNGAFVVAGIAALVMIVRQDAGRRRAVDVWLAALVCIIGVGSFLFHTLATGWAALADTVPIGVLMLSYLVMAERKFLGLSWWWTTLGVAAFLCAMVAVRYVPCDGGACLNGTIGYLPALVAMVLVGGWLAVRRQRTGLTLLAGTAVFAVSMTFRSLDRALCDDTAVGDGMIGLHFMWHLLNAVALFILVRAAVLWRREARN